MMIEGKDYHSTEWMKSLRRTIGDKVVADIKAFLDSPAIYWDFRYKGDLLLSFSKRKEGIVVRFLGPNGYEENVDRYE